MQLMFVADVIPNELRAIVEFLNEQMSSGSHPKSCPPICCPSPGVARRRRRRPVAGDAAMTGPASGRGDLARRLGVPPGVLQEAAQVLARA
jgi:hypothetical protein